MITTIIEWRATAEELPEESGEYLVYSRAGYMTALSFSSVHKKFNVFDRYTKDEVNELAIECKYWTLMPEFPEDESEDE
jgi:hypothetical protein